MTQQQYPDQQRRLTLIADQIERACQMLVDLSDVLREQAAEVRNIAQSLPEGE